MAAEVKLVLDNKIATDKSKGETTSTTRTQCVSLLPLLSPVEGGPRALNHSATSTRSVFEKTYAYVKRMSFPNATVETAHSIRQCVHSAKRRTSAVQRELLLPHSQPVVVTLPCLSMFAERWLVGA
jgi:hypothetical protein